MAEEKKADLRLHSCFEVHKSRERKHATFLHVRAMYKQLQHAGPWQIGTTSRFPLSECPARIPYNYRSALLRVNDVLGWLEQAHTHLETLHNHPHP